MRWFLSFAVLVTALGFANVSTSAQDNKEKKKAPTPEERFKSLDKDSDGKLSPAEYKGKAEGEKATKAEERFKKIDKDSDGYLSLEEFVAAAPKKKDK